MQKWIWPAGTVELRSTDQSKSASFVKAASTVILLVDVDSQRTFDAAGKLLDEARSDARPMDARVDPQGIDGVSAAAQEGNWCAGFVNRDEQVCGRKILRSDQHVDLRPIDWCQEMMRRIDRPPP